MTKNNAMFTFGGMENGSTSSMMMLFLSMMQNQQSGVPGTNSMSSVLWRIITTYITMYLPEIRHFTFAALAFLWRIFQNTSLSIYLRSKFLKEEDIHESIKVPEFKDKEKEDAVWNTILYHIDTARLEKLQTVLVEECTLSPAVTILEFWQDRYFSFSKNVMKMKSVDIYVQIKNVNKVTQSINDGHSSPQESVTFDLQLMSTACSVSEIRQEVERMIDRFDMEKQTQYGSRRFFFDVNLMLSDTFFRNRMYVFECIQFQTNKSLSNTYGNHLKKVRDRVTFFINNRDFYKEQGLPYTLGILLHGPPGTGKTSLIKAIAKDLNRHIINIRFSIGTKCEQLRSLFFSPDIQVTGNTYRETELGRASSTANPEPIPVPFENRLYVMEDIDANNTSILSRAHQNDTSSILSHAHQNDTSSILSPTHPNSQSFLQEARLPTEGAVRGRSLPKDAFQKMVEEENKLHEERLTRENLNLSFLLNLFDGIIETPGRVMIMTSNHPEKLDAALIRPGRIDLMVEVGYCDESIVREMFSKFFSIPQTHASFPSFAFITAQQSSKLQLSPAALWKIFMDHFQAPELCYQALVDMYKIQKNT